MAQNRVDSPQSWQTVCRSICRFQWPLPCYPATWAQRSDFLLPHWPWMLAVASPRWWGLNPWAATSRCASWASARYLASTVTVNPSIKWSESSTGPRAMGPSTWQPQRLCQIWQSTHTHTLYNQSLNPWNEHSRCASWDLCRVNLVDWTSRSSHTQDIIFQMHEYSSKASCSVHKDAEAEKAASIRDLQHILFLSKLLRSPWLSFERCGASVPWRHRSPGQTSGRPQMPWATAWPQLFHWDWVWSKLGDCRF